MLKVKKNKNEKVVVKSEPVVKVDPGLKPSPIPESKLDVLDDNEEEKEDKDENLPDKIEFEQPEQYYERASFYEEDEKAEDEDVADACQSIRDVPREE